MVQFYVVIFGMHLQKKNSTTETVKSEQAFLPNYYKAFQRLEHKIELCRNFKVYFSVM